jgi:hypothetical protein
MYESRPEACHQEASAGLARWLCRHYRNKNRASGYCRKKRADNIRYLREPKRQPPITARARQVGAVAQSQEFPGPGESPFFAASRSLASSSPSTRIVEPQILSARLPRIQISEIRIVDNQKPDIYTSQHKQLNDLAGRRHSLGGPPPPAWGDR